jgi:hypothetical protein
VHWVFAAAAYERQPPPPLTLTPTFPLPFYTVFVSVVWVGSKKQKSVRDWATSMTLYLMYKKGALVILCTWVKKRFFSPLLPPPSLHSLMYGKRGFVTAVWMER